MTGSEHYQEAERWNSYAEEIYRENGQGDPEFLAAGQLAASIASNHATLALAAASLRYGVGVPVAPGWVPANSPAGSAPPKLIEILRCLVDDEDCQFDHHGGCQAHGYLSLEPGEKCPQREAKELLAGIDETGGAQ